MKEYLRGGFQLGTVCRDTHHSCDAAGMRLGRASEEGDGGCAYGTQATTREAGRSAGLGGSALGEREMREVRG